jgi:SRSO17 transposase
VLKGVERPYAGTLGKVGNGQIAVTCCDSEPQATWPVAVRWSRPKTWAYDRQRRQPTRVPEEIPLRTTPEIALLRLAQARAWAGPHRGVVAATHDGDHPHALAGLAQRQHASAQFHQAATGALGGDQDQGRLWPGCQRHAVTEMRASSLLGGLEQRQRQRQTRQRRPRDPCPPAAAVPAQDTAGSAA